MQKNCVRLHFLGLLAFFFPYVYGLKAERQRWQTAFASLTKQIKTKEISDWL